MPILGTGPYHLCKKKLTIEDNILLWGYRVVLPQTLTFTMLNLLTTLTSELFK